MRRRATTALVLVGVLLTGCRHNRPPPKPAAVVAAPITVPIAGRPSAVTVAGGLVWVADDERGVIETVDEKTGRLVGTPIKVGPSPIALATDQTTVWVADATGILTGISIRDRRIDQAVTFTGTLSSVDTAGGTVWVTDVANGRLFAYETGGTPVPPIQIPQGAVRAAAEGTSVWVTNGENTVTRVDTTTSAPEPPIAVGTGPIGLAVHQGVVWVANSEDDTVSRVGAGLNGPVPAPTPVAKAPVAIALGADGGWVISQDARRLTRLDAVTGKVLRSLAIDTRPRGIALGTDRVWIAGVERNVVVGVPRSALGA